MPLDTFQTTFWTPAEAGAPWLAFTTSLTSSLTSSLTLSLTSVKEPATLLPPGPPWSQRTIGVAEATTSRVHWLLLSLWRLLLSLWRAGRSSLGQWLEG
jgi:hypothetical protein